MAQEQLSELLLIYPDDDRKLAVPTLSLRSLVGNPAESALGWNSVCHPKNTTLHGYEKWLLNRVLWTGRLRNDFFRVPKRAIWRDQAVSEYITNVERFLESLRLLVHITGHHCNKLPLTHSRLTVAIIVGLLGTSQRPPVFIYN
jgi:hypothetical protein